MAMISMKHCTVFPLYFALFMVVSVMSTYLISVTRGDVEAWLPGISSTGGSPPESGVLCLAYDITGLCIIFVGASLHLSLCDTAVSNGIKRLSYYGAIFALMSGIGLMVVGGYPVRAEPVSGSKKWTVMVPHHLGAGTAFGTGIIFLGIQSFISWKTYALFRPPRILVISRIVLVVCTVSTLILMNAVRSKSFLSFFDQELEKLTAEKQDLRHQTMSSLFEWISYFCYALIISTFYWDFSFIEVSFSSKRVNKEFVTLDTSFNFDDFNYKRKYAKSQYLTDTDN